MRTNKKLEYINSIQHDIEAYSGIVRGSKFFDWMHGDYISRVEAGNRLAELVEELNKIFADKNYKPWKD